MEHIIIYSKNRYFVTVITILMIFITILDARRYKKVIRHKRSSSANALSGFLKNNNILIEGDSKKVYKYRRKRKYKRGHRRRSKKSSKAKSTTANKVAVASAVVATASLATIYTDDEKKIQNSLKNLNFYSAKIDGNANNFETRSAITNLNRKFGNGDTPFLDREVKDTLIYLSDLYSFNNNLSLKGDSDESKMAKIQTALKILGFYHEDIDGITGPSTRSAISDYRASQKLSASEVLDFEDEYQLISKAKELNDQNIKKAKYGLSLHSKISIDEPKKDIMVKEHRDKIEPEEKIKQPKSDMELSDSFE